MAEPSRARPCTQERPTRARPSVYSSQASRGVPAGVPVVPSRILSVRDRLTLVKPSTQSSSQFQFSQEKWSRTADDPQTRPSVRPVSMSRGSVQSTTTRSESWCFLNLGRPTAEKTRNPAQYYFCTYEPKETHLNSGFWMNSKRASRKMFLGEKDKFNILNDPDLFKSNLPNAHLVMDFKKQLDRKLLPQPKEKSSTHRLPEKPPSKPARFKKKTQVHPIMDTQSLKSLFMDNLHKYQLYDLNCLQRKRFLKAQK